MNLPGREAGNLLPAWLLVALSTGVCLGFSAVLTGCGETASPTSTPQVSAFPELGEIQHPSLEGVERAARVTLAGLRGSLGDLLSKAETPPQDLAEAFGRMGQAYHAYGLASAANQCYGNAATLAPQDYRWPSLRGSLALKSGHLTEAEGHLRKALELAPGDAPARLHLGEVLLQTGRTEAARESFLAVLDGPPPEGQAPGPHDPAALYGLGRAAQALGEPAAAVEALEKVLKLRPEAGAARYPLAQALRKLGRREEAQQLLAQSSRGEVPLPDPLADAIDELAVSSGALLGRGSEALVNGRVAEAQQWYRKAVAADPRSSEARRNLALSLSRGGEHQEARKVLEAALRMHPEEALLSFDLANAQLATGDPNDAIASFQRALAIAPDFEAAHFNLANTLMQLQRWQEAQGHLDRVLEISPGDPRALYQRAMCLYQGGQQEEGLKDLKEVLAAAPDLSAARLSLASILAQRKDLLGARHQYQEILRLDPSPASQANAHLQLGLLAQQTHNPVDAESNLRRAMAAEPKNLEASMALAQFLLQRARGAEAVEILEPLQADNPKNVELRYRLITALIGSGDHLAGRQALEEGLKALPQDLALNHTLARLLATSPNPQVRDGQRALRLAQSVYSSERSLDHAETIAMAMAETGDLKGAAGWQRGLLQQAQQMNDRNLTNRIAVNLRSYEAGRPVRMTGR